MLHDHGKKPESLTTKWLRRQIGFEQNPVPSPLALALFAAATAAQNARRFPGLIPNLCHQVLIRRILHQGRE